MIVISDPFNRTLEELKYDLNPDQTQYTAQLLIEP